MKDDPDGNFFIVLPNGDEVFASDLSSYYYADADGSERESSMPSRWVIPVSIRELKLW